MSLIFGEDDNFDAQLNRKFGFVVFKLLKSKVPAGNMATLTNFLKFLKNYLKVSGQTVHGSRVSCYTSYIKR